MAVLAAGEAVDNFVERAIAAAGDDEAAFFGGGAGGDFGGVAGAGGFGEVGVNAARGENVARLVEQAATAVAAAASVGIVDEKRVLKVGGHLVRFACDVWGDSFILYNVWRIRAEVCKRVVLKS